MKILKGKTPYIIAISFAIIATVLLFSIRQSVIIDPVRHLVFDTYQQITPRNSENSSVVVVDIDEISIRTTGQWPWPRTILAEITQKLHAAGALAIGYDMVFSEPDRTSPARISSNLPENIDDRDAIRSALSSLPNHDVLFANQMAKAPIVLGFFDLGSPNEEVIEKKAGISWLGANLTDLLVSVDGAVGSLPGFQKAAIGHGSVSIGEAQFDNIIRNMSLFSNYKGEVFPSLAIETLRIAIQNATGEQQSFLIKTSQSGTEGASGKAITDAKVANFEFPLTATGGFNIYYAPNSQTRYISAQSILGKTTSEIASLVEGKIVLIGTSAPGLRDIRTTTLREGVPGVAIHAQIIDQIMDGAFLNRPDWAPGAEIVLAIALTLLMILVLPMIGALASAFFGMICTAAVLIISWLAFDWNGILFDPAVPLVTALTAYILTTLLLFAFAEKEKRFVRSAFQHYLSPTLLAKLEDDPTTLKLGGEVKEMTLMFMDVRNFTSISEKLSPEELVAFLNDLLSPLSEIIQRHDGAIDKYIGDSIMAFWNAPLNVEDHPKKACLAALEMLEKVREMNAANLFRFNERGLGPVGIGIGINTGKGCVGNMGSADRFDYSVVGDSVNVAARLESATKDTKWPILLSEATAKQVPELAKLGAGKIELKGKSEEQPVFALIGNEKLTTSDRFIKLAESHGDLIEGSERKAHRKRQSTEDLLEHCLSLAPVELHEFLVRSAK